MTPDRCRVGRGESDGGMCVSDGPGCRVGRPRVVVSDGAKCRVGRRKASNPATSSITGIICKPVWS